MNNGEPWERVRKSGRVRFRVDDVGEPAIGHPNEHFVAQGETNIIVFLSGCRIEAGLELDFLAVFKQRCKSGRRAGDLVDGGRDLDTGNFLQYTT